MAAQEIAPFCAAKKRESPRNEISVVVAPTTEIERGEVSLELRKQVY